MNDQKAWKVVLNRDGRLVSWIARFDLRVEYRPGEWVTGKWGPLFVCLSLEEARGLYELDERAEIWECEVRGLRRARHALAGHIIWLAVQTEAVKQWWEGQKELSGREILLPEAVGVCDEVKLLTRIQK